MHTETTLSTGDHSLPRIDAQIYVEMRHGAAGNNENLHDHWSRHARIYGGCHMSVIIGMSEETRCVRGAWEPHTPD